MFLMIFSISPTLIHHLDFAIAINQLITRLIGRSYILNLYGKYVIGVVSVLVLKHHSIGTDATNG
jgi:hypothetical protein